MRVLFVDQFGELGGAQHCLLDLLPALRESGRQAAVAAPSTGPLLACAAELGARTAPLRFGSYASGAKPTAQAIRFCADTLRAIRTLESEIGASRPDVLYANGPRVLPAVAFVARRRGLPLLFHCHHRLTDGPSISVTRQALRYGRARVIACCRFAAVPIEDIAGPAGPQIIYNGVRGSAEAPVRPATGGRTVGVLGRIAPEKGQAEFLAAARIVAGSDGEIRFAVCGAPLFGDPESERYAQELRRAADGLPVEFMGWRDDIHEVLAGWDVLVVPSVREPGATRVILEAFSCGVPVVAFATGGIPEVVDDGRTGLLVDSTDPVSLAQELLALLRNDDQLSQLGDDGRAEWGRRFSLERYQREVLEVIELATDGAGGADD